MYALELLLLVDELLELEHEKVIKNNITIIQMINIVQTFAPIITTILYELLLYKKRQYFQITFHTKQMPTL